MVTAKKTKPIELYREWGAPEEEEACGEDIRPEVILAASMKQEPTV